MHGDTMPILKRSGRGRALYYPKRIASTLFSTCNVLSQFSHSVPIMLGNQAATKLHIAVKHRKQAWPETSDHPSSITHGEQDTSTGTNSSWFLFFCPGTQQQQAGSGLMCCDWHSPCTARGGDSHGWRLSTTSVLLFKLSREIGLSSCLTLHLTVHFYYQITLWTLRSSFWISLPVFSGFMARSLHSYSKMPLYGTGMVLYMDLNALLQIL